MIKKITVENTLAITKPVEIDFMYKNYPGLKGRLDEIIDTDKQVWIDNKVSLVKAILGKNATGKTSFMEGIRILNNLNFHFTSGASVFLPSFSQIIEEDVYEYLVDEINPDLEDFQTVNETRSFRFRRKVEKDAMNAKIHLTTDASLDERVIEYIRKNSKKMFNRSLMNHFVWTEMSKIDNAVVEIEYTSPGTDKTASYIFTGRDVIMKEEGRTTSLLESIASNIEITFGVSDTNFIEINISSIRATLKKFFSVVNNISLISLANNNDSFHQLYFGFSQKNKSIHINDQLNILVEKTSDKFVEKFLRIIDPTIFGLSRPEKKLPSYRRGSRNSLGIKLIHDNIMITPSSLSSGTKQFIIMLNEVIEALEQGAMVMIDEMDNGLQIRLAKLIIDLFTNENTNKNCAQLVFTTHNINYLALGIIDQRNHIISFRNPSEVEFTNYFDLMKSSVKEPRTRKNIAKYFFDESLFEKNPIYPFLITRKERDEIMAEITNITNKVSHKIKSGSESEDR